MKNVLFKAEPVIKTGDSLRLECDYDLENAQLYSIKWYFGDDEFYRYVPKESPPTRVFPRKGVSVDVSIAVNDSFLGYFLYFFFPFFSWRASVDDFIRG